MLDIERNALIEDALRHRKPLTPAEGGPWTVADIMALAYVCRELAPVVVQLPGNTPIAMIMASEYREAA